VGGPNATGPGQTSDATVTLEPGNYAIVCFVPTPGATPVPHIMKGMFSALTVTPSSAPSAEPVADVNVRLSDYKFTSSKPLSAGRHVIKVTNDAAQPHEIVFVKLESVQIDLVSDGALATGIQHARVRIDGQDIDDRRAFVDWFVKSDGKWQFRVAVDLPAPIEAAGA